MLIDLHAHSGGISRCCKIPYEQVIDTAKKIGLDGIVLTNHYDRGHFNGDDSVTFSHRYTEEYRLAKAYGDSVGCCVLFGAEVTLERHDNAHILLYGIDEEFIHTHHDLFSFSQEQLYCAVKAAGGAMIQAHPYRHKENLLDTRFLDGVEVNCHPQYQNSYFAQMKEIAQKSCLILTCGGDYHADTYRPKCGTYLADTIQNEKELATYLLDTNEIILRIHEPNTDAPYDYHYTRQNL